MGMKHKIIMISKMFIISSICVSLQFEIFWSIGQCKNR